MERTDGILLPAGVQVRNGARLSPIKVASTVVGCQLAIGIAFALQMRFERLFAAAAFGALCGLLIGKRIDTATEARPPLRLVRLDCASKPGRWKVICQQILTSQNRYALRLSPDQLKDLREGGGCDRCESLEICSGEIENAAEFESLLACCPKVKHLVLDQCKLDFDWKELAATRFPSVKSLMVKGMDTESTSELAGLLAPFPNCAKVVLESCFFCAGCLSEGEGQILHQQARCISFAGSRFAGLAVAPLDAIGQRFPSASRVIVPHTPEAKFLMGTESVALDYVKDVAVQPCGHLIGYNSAMQMKECDQCRAPHDLPRIPFVPRAVAYEKTDAGWKTVLMDAEDHPISGRAYYHPVRECGALFRAAPQKRCSVCDEGPPFREVWLTWTPETEDRLPQTLGELQQRLISAQ
jgi:hypothetical protein